MFKFLFVTMEVTESLPFTLLIREVCINNTEQLNLNLVVALSAVSIGLFDMLRPFVGVDLWAVGRGLHYYRDTAQSSSALRFVQ